MGNTLMKPRQADRDVSVQDYRACFVTKAFSPQYALEHDAEHNAEHNAPRQPSSDAEDTR